LLWAWIALFAVTYVNPGFARQFHFNLTVPALAVLATLHLARCFRLPDGRWEFWRKTVKNQPRPQ